jgi:hypothetical protein
LVGVNARHGKTQVAERTAWVGLPNAATYLRMLLIQEAKSAVMTAHERDDPISTWVDQLREKSGWQKAAVAMANKNAHPVGNDKQGT